jgi:hypothetical protein
MILISKSTTEMMNSATSILIKRILVYELIEIESIITPEISMHMNEMRSTNNEDKDELRALEFKLMR